MKRAFGLLWVALGVAVLVGCNTLQGIGRDIEAAGKGIQRSTR